MDNDLNGDSVGMRSASYRKRVGFDGKKGKKLRREKVSSEKDRMSPWKTAAVAALVAVCFMLLYPNMIHPVIVNFLGASRMQSASPPVAESRKAPSQQARQAPLDRHIHPGMRMAAQQVSPSVAKGVWSYMLPCYTIGVIVFLLYTLSKIMFKPKPNRSRKYDLQFNTSREKFEVDGPAFSSSEDRNSDSDENIPFAGSRMSKKELRKLQSRLQQTEEAMSNILQQLEQVSQSNNDPTITETAKKMTQETISQLSKITRSSDNIHHLQSNDEENGEMESENDQVGSFYLKDLEKALSDFKSLSEAYTVRASQMQQRSEDDLQNASERSNNDLNTSESDYDEQNVSEKSDSCDEIRSESVHLDHVADHIVSPIGVSKRN